jgi:hypothetical protein
VRRRLVRWFLVVLSVAVALAVVGVIGLTWESRAEDICREQAPRTTSEYSVTWDWDGFAYVCDYREPSEQPKRIGILDAFHSGDSRRHR